MTGRCDWSELDPASCEHCRTGVRRVDCDPGPVIGTAKSGERMLETDDLFVLTGPSLCWRCRRVIPAGETARFAHSSAGEPVVVHDDC